MYSHVLGGSIVDESQDVHIVSWMCVEPPYYRSILLLWTDVGIEIIDNDYHVKFKLSQSSCSTTMSKLRTFNISDTIRALARKSKDLQFNVSVHVGFMSYADKSCTYPCQVCSEIHPTTNNVLAAPNSEKRRCLIRTANQRSHWSWLHDLQWQLVPQLAPWGGRGRSY